MTNPLAAVKRAPKWTWYTVAGVGIAAGAAKVWRDRAAPEGETVASDGTPIGSADVPSSTTVGSVGSPTGVIVPPVIISGGSSDDPGLPALSNLYVGAMQDVLGGWSTLSDSWAGLTGSLQQQNSNAFDSMTDIARDLIANAGSAPAPVVVNPTPVTVEAPRIAPGAPVAAPVGQLPCPASYPHRSARGCYKVACASGKGGKSAGHWHLYSDGQEYRVSTAC